MSKKDKTVARQRPSPVAPSPSFPSNASFPLTSFSPGTGWFALSHVLCPRCPGGGALHILAASPAETPRYVSRPKQSDVQDPEISKTRPLSVLFRVETFPSLSWLLFSADHSSFRDFAYVARDRNSRRFMCHVFRCDTPARTIANTLRDICKRLMLQRRPNVLHALDSASVGGERRLTRESSLPTPIEEPKKVLRCHFLGVTQVPRATGIDILNDAVDRLVNQIRPERWILADVSIAPSTISINEVGGGQIAQCRVRYLSFLGIGSDIK
uniref:PID domain-containing protein n=1 Tax=Steinernema glaseri TaxID=37863 RepID=A0A1I8AME4_9BILA